MNRTNLISNLNANSKVFNALPKSPSLQSRYDIVSIITACVVIIHDCCCDFNAWLGRSGRRAQLTKLLTCKGVLTQKAKDVLSQLITYTISCVETVTWSTDFLPYGLPVLVAPRGTRTEAQRKAISAGMAAGRARKAAQREARDNFFRI